MGAPPSLHPTDQTLQAYGLGTLDEDTSASIDSHLAECSACRQRASEMSGDSFLGRLREAQGGSSMAGAKRRASSSISDDGPPRELLDHPDYEVVRELGRGGMGVVYLANNTLMGRMEVLKVVGSHLVKRQGVLDRFLREIRSAAKLHHPNIVGAYAAMRLGEGVVLAMEYVEGEDLAQLVKARGPLPVTNACYFTYQAALGLQHAHERGMVHRDIKPANLILAREGKKAIVKVLDFGLAKATSEGQLDAGLTHEGQMLGTPDFIAPEQIVDAQKADIRADIYSLGCTLYYLLNGGAPFRATSLYELLQAHHSMDAPALNMVRPEVPAELAALVAKMMAKDPARRFQTPGEVAQALTRFFKPGVQPASTSSAEVPRAVPAPAPTPPPTVAATDVAAPVPPPITRKPPSKPGPEGVAWESLIEFKETEPPTLAIRPAAPEPKPEPSAAGKPPRNWWPIIAAASAAGSVLLGIIITIVSRDGSKTSLDIPSDRAVKGTIDGVPFGHTPPSKAQADAKPSDSSAPDVANVPAKPTVTLTAGPAPEVRGGAWRVEGDELFQSTLARGATLVFGDPTWSHYDFKFRAMSTGGTHGFKAKFHWTGPGNSCEFALGNYFNKYHDVSFESIGRWGRPNGMIRPGRVEFARWYDVRVEARGSEFRCFLDGTQIFQGRYDGFTAGRVGFATWDNTARFRDIEVTTPDGRTLSRGLPVPPASQSTAADAPAGPVDLFRAGSVWIGTRTYRKGAGVGRSTRYELNITERNGARFLGHVLEDGPNRAEVEGEVEGSSIAWRERSDRNSNQVIRTRGTLSGNMLSLTFDNNYTGAMSRSGDSELSWAGGGQDAPEGSTPGYVPIFNKRDIAGWWAWGKSGPMSATEMQPVWTVRDGDLIGSRELSHLFSPRGDYADFRVRAEVKVNEKGNSGLYFRAQKGPGFPQGYEAQINATHGDPARTGSLYKAGLKGPVRTVAASPVPSNTWFTLEAEAVGNHIRIWVDGKPTADWIDPHPTHSRGHFAIQVHDPNTEVQVRELEVMELDASGRPLGGAGGRPAGSPAAPPAVAARPAVPSAAKGGPRSLFNGVDLQGWQTDRGASQWGVRNGQLVAAGTGDWRNQSYLLSNEDFSDFRLRFEVQTPRGVDSGVALRADPAAMQAILQVNITTRDSPANRNGSLRWRKQDANYLPPSRGAEFGPESAWNQFVIEARGEIVTIWANGLELLRQDLAQFKDDPDAMPGLMRRAGRVGFQSHTGTVRFRNIRIEELESPGRDVAANVTPGRADAKPAAPADSAGRPLDIRNVPVHPGLIKLSAAPPDAFQPELRPYHTENWRAADPALVSMVRDKGLVIDAGPSGNFLLTSRSDYKKCALKVQLSASANAEAYLILRAAEGPDGWRGVTSRIVDEGGKIRAGLQSLDFATPERGDARVEFKPEAPFRMIFSMDEANKGTVYAQLRTTTVAHEGPRHLDPAGAVGLFVRKGSVTVQSMRVDE